MAVVGNAEERWQDRTANFNGGVWTYTRAWLVKTDDKTDREDTVSGATGLPAYGAAHPNPVDVSVGAYANTISYAPFVEESPTAWKVTVGYSSERTLNDNPESDEVLVSWTSEIYQEPVFEDNNGDAILNSAGDYFIDPAPTRDAAHLIAKIRANVASVPAWVITYQNAINDSSITVGGLVVAIGLAKMQRMEIGERQKRGSYTFYPLSFELHIHVDGWNLTPLDAGFRERNGSDELVQITNEGDGTEVTTPVPLDGSGAAMTDPTPATAVYGDFDIYTEKDFTVLPGVT